MNLHPFPPEVWHHLFSFCNRYDRSVCRYVCRLWYAHNRTFTASVLAYAVSLKCRNLMQWSVVYHREPLTRDVAKQACQSNQEILSFLQAHFPAEGWNPFWYLAVLRDNNISLTNYLVDCGCFKREWVQEARIILGKEEVTEKGS